MIIVERSELMNKARLIYLDLIKILAILLVIFNHSYWYIYGGTLVTIFTNLLFSFCKIAVPLFVMVTGALLLGKNTSYKEILTKRIYRIVVPLFFVTALCIIMYGGSVKDFIAVLFTNFGFENAPYWLWYLYLLIALYLMTPFLQKMIKNFEEKDYRYFILIFVFGIGLINMVPTVSSLVFGHSLKINESFTMNLFPMMVGYYVLGFYLSKKEITDKLKKYSFIGLILTLVLTTCFFTYGINHGIDYDGMLNNSYFLTALLATFVFVIFKYYFSKPFKSIKINNFIVMVSNSIFGVYLFHVLVIKYLHSTSIIQVVSDYNTVIGVFLLDILTFVILTFVVWFLRKIPILKKFL